MPNDDDSPATESGTFGGLLREIAKSGAGEGSGASNLVGATLHQFQVQALLGRGGMGIVYRAQDTRLGRKVALKVLRHGPSDDADSRRRFLREARSAAAIAHPNIAAVYEVEEAEGHVFLVMELIEGETLRERLRSGPLPVAETVRIGKAIARGLAKAHEKGIVHRDLKPENVMITREGDVKILDFGLAKLHEAGSLTVLGEAKTEQQITEEGRVLGTPAYMPPEQVTGNIDAMGPASDIYSLGVIFYELLAGRPPFDSRVVWVARCGRRSS